MKLRLDSLVNVALLAAAGIVLFKHFENSDTSRTGQNRDIVLSAEEWKEIGEAATIVRGTGSASLKFVVFTDFECPYCKSFHERLTNAMDEHSQSTSLAILHFPLPSHKFSRQAATAFECGRNSTQRNRLASLFYAKQDSIGLLSWNDFGRRAGVLDSVAFAGCLELDNLSVAAHVRLGERLRLRATPTVIVNGVRLAGPPTDRQLDSIFKSTSEAKP